MDWAIGYLLFAILFVLSFLQVFDLVQGALLFNMKFSKALQVRALCLARGRGEGRSPPVTALVASTGSTCLPSPIECMVVRVEKLCASHHCASVPLLNALAPLVPIALAASKRRRSPRPRTRTHTNP